MRNTIIYLIEWTFIIIFLRTAEISILNWQFWAIWLVVSAAYTINYFYDVIRD